MRTIFAIAVVFALLLTGCPAGDDGSKSDKTNEPDPTDIVDDPIVDQVTGEVIFLHLVHVEKGTFEMGKSGDGTIANNNNTSMMRTVTLTQDFYIGKYEVTQAQWKAVMGETLEERQLAAAPNTSTNFGRGDAYPMYYTSWFDALVFCNKLSIMEGFSPAYSIEINGEDKTDPDEWGEIPTATTDENYAKYAAVKRIANSTGYQLPTEAQWEYAAKGGQKASDPYYLYPGSNRINLVAWNYNNNGTSGTELYGAKRVGTKQANELGIHDMVGNEAEWCLDDFKGTYNPPTESTATDPLNWTGGSTKNTRGGYWFDSGNRSVSSSFYYPYNRLYMIGFRIVRPVTQ